MLFFFVRRQTKKNRLFGLLVVGCIFFRVSHFFRWTAQRAALARELIMSLDGPRDDSVEQAWNDEIVRRVSNVKSGKATLLSREEFRSKMRARLGQ